MSKDTLLKYSTGSMENTAFADQLMGAVEKKGKEDAAKEAIKKTIDAVIPTPAPVLPDLEKIEVSEVVLPTLEGAKETIRAEADGTRQWAEAAGEKLIQLEDNIERIRAEIYKIEKDPNSKFSSTAQKLIADLKMAEAKEKGKLDQLLSVSNEAAKAHMSFAALLAEIRTADPSHLGEVRELYNRVVKLGHRRVVSKKEIDDAQAAKKPLKGLIFLEGTATVFTADSAGGRGLEAELRKLTDAAKNSKAASIKARADETDLSKFANKKLGKYYFYSPKRIKKGKGGEEYRIGEGHALVELVDINKGKFDVDKGKKVFRKPFIVVFVRDAIGSMGKFLEKNDRYIPFEWIEKTRVMTSDDHKLPKDEFDRAVSLIWTLRDLVHIWEESWKPAQPVITPEQVASCVNVVPETDMSTVVVETKATDKTEKPATPKSKKAKKAE